MFMEIWERPSARRSLFFILVYLSLLSIDFSSLYEGTSFFLGATTQVELTRGLMAAAIVLNFVLITRLPNRIQLYVTWAELLFLFLYFFYSFDLSYEYIWTRLPHLLGFGLKNGFLMGTALTLFMCVVSIAASTVLALVAALARLSNNGVALGISTFYISFFRGTPLILQILLIYIGLPQIGIILNPIPAAIIALSLCYGAYMAEIFRAGIQAIPAGQGEAARALGLKDVQIMRLVILPQAIRLIIPPTGNQFIAMLKDSALVATLGAWELMYMARLHGRAEFKNMEMMITAALIYWMLSMSMEYFQAKIERKFGKGIDVNNV
ncbi:amino acid ABC transporter permease [Kiloniella sp.]|uniref:amino acid ABC transporter permease n=1 Tax=Kiloniella sp. TaxID=1938587 RepID=UPI003B02A8D7